MKNAFKRAETMLGQMAAYVLIGVCGGIGLTVGVLLVLGAAMLLGFGGLT